MIRKKQKLDKIIIDLDGSEGNAYNLMGVAKNLMRRLGFGDENPLVKAVLKEMTSGDYNNLVKVFDKHFGDMVILEYSGFREIK
jgi:hypothetical protein